MCAGLPAMTDSPPANSPDSFPAAPRPSATEALDRLLAIMARLRDPDGGCPWDLKQNFATIAPYTIEEAYEVADALDQQDMEAQSGRASGRKRVSQNVKHPVVP